MPIVRPKIEDEEELVSAESGIVRPAIGKDAVIDKAEAPSTWEKVKKFLPTPNEAGRMGLQAAGSIIGGVVGSGTTPVAGTVAGGALGYAVGDKAADFLYGDRAIETPNSNYTKRAIDELKQTGKDVGTGLLYELFGPLTKIAGKGLWGVEQLYKGVKDKGVKGLINESSDRFIKNRAANQLAANITKTEPEASRIVNREMASADLESNIPGLKFSTGEYGGDANLLSLAKAKGSIPGRGVATKAESDIAKNESLRRYIKSNITGSGEAGDFLTGLERHGMRLNEDVNRAKGYTEHLATEINKGTSQEIGSNILNKVRKAKEASSNIATELYNKVPRELETDSTPLWNKVNELFGDYNGLTQSTGITPIKPMSNIKEAMSKDASGRTPIPETLADLRKAMDSGILDRSGNRIQSSSEVPVRNLTLGELQDFRSQVTTAQRIAQASNTPGSDVLAWKYGQLKDAIQDSMTATVEKGGGPGVDALKEAIGYYRNVHVPQFKQGTNLAVLKNAQTGEQRVVNSNIGSSYFKPGKGAPEAADDFLRTFGDNPEARELIKDYAAQTLLREARDKETGELTTKGYQKWKYKYQDALKKYGLEDSFSSIENASVLADKARETEAKFNNSAIIKALGVNPEKYIETTLMTGAGKKQSVARLKEMTDLARSEGQPAVDGLRTAIGDYFEKNVGIVMDDIAAGKMSSYHKLHSFWNDMRPAIKESGLYTPQQVEAWNNIHKALQVVSRQGKMAIKKGPSTTSKMLGSALAGGASMASGHLGSYSMVQHMYNAIGAETTKKIDDAVVRALYDPRYAEELLAFINNSQKVGVQKAATFMGSKIDKLNESIGRMAVIGAHPGGMSKGNIGAIAPMSGINRPVERNPLGLDLPPLEE